MSARTVVAPRRFRGSARRPSTLRWYLPIALASVTVARWGVGTRTFAVVGVLTVVTFLHLPAWIWAASAVGVAIVIRAFTVSGILPSILDFADFALIFLGLTAVFLRRGITLDRDARRLGGALLVLLTVACFSWAMSPSDLLRPFFAFVLWAEPFVLVLMLLADPPDRKEQRILMTWFGALVVLQIPFALHQWLTLGVGDPIVGTLLAPGGGSHSLAGIGALVTIALITWAFSRSSVRGVGVMLVTAPLLIGLLVITDAKQVTLALPIAAIILLVTVRGAVGKFALLVPSVIALIILFSFVPAGKAALTFLEEAGQGKSGKLIGLEVFRQELDGSLSGWVLGVGPANGLSRAAYLTDPTFGREGSPLFLLNLRPATLPPIAVAAAKRTTSETSFNYPLSSLLGLLTDIGLVGLLAFAAVIGSLILPLWRRRREWLAQTALAGWAMSIPLAANFDWWEQPPFMLTLALLTALALVWIPTAPTMDASIDEAIR